MPFIILAIVCKTATAFIHHFIFCVRVDSGYVRTAKNLVRPLNNFYKLVITTYNDIINDIRSIDFFYVRDRANERMSQVGPAPSTPCNTTGATGTLTELF